MWTKKSNKKDGSRKTPKKSSALANEVNCSPEETVKNMETTDRDAVEGIGSAPCSIIAKSSPCKGTDASIIAYVHCLSPSRRNKKNTLDYSTLVLQSESKPAQEALLYSKNKRPLLSDSEHSHTPVKIQRYTHTTDGEKMIINDMTMISVPDQTEYSFQFKETTGPSSEPTPVEDILQSCNEWDCVTLCAKAIHVGETVVVSGKKLRLAESTFADTTGSIAVDLWEQHIPMVESGKVYLMTSMQVRVWLGKKKLSTTLRSVIRAKADDTLEEIAVCEDDIKSNTRLITVKVPNIHSVEKVETTSHCLNCGRKLLQSTASKIVHCDRCGYTMRIANCSKRLSVKVVVESEGELIHLTAFQNTLEKVVKCDVGGEAEIAEMLLLLDEVTVTYNSKSLVIEELQL